MWLDYLKERKIVFFLYVGTLVIFLSVITLCGFRDGGMIAYCVMLSAFLWVVAAAFDFYYYHKKRKQVNLVKDFIFKEDDQKYLWELAREIQEKSLLLDKSSAMEADYIQIIQRLCQENIAQQKYWENKNLEQGDYYMMWAHQIKTPIAAMRLSIQDNFPLQEELFKIEQYVEMLLHYQRLEAMSSDLILQQYDLDGLVKSAVKKYSLSFINSGMRLNMDTIAGSITTDDKWFTFCLEQILSNSIKYGIRGRQNSQDGKEGIISIYTMEEGKVLVVEDNGIGIRAEDMPRIFEKGFTGYNGRLDKKATGIGLYLTKSILDKLGIHIRVESIEGKGTSVYLTQM